MLCWAYCPDSSIEVKDGAMTGIDLLLGFSLGDKLECAEFALLNANAAALAMEQVDARHCAVFNLNRGIGAVSPAQHAVGAFLGIPDRTIGAPTAGVAVG